jgi:hypothetical protein
MCVSSTVYNWCGAVLENMKDQLTKCRLGWQKKFVMDRFCYLSSSSEFPLYVHGMGFQKLGSGSSDEKVDRFTFPTRGGGAQFQFDAKFFRWWDRQIVVIDDYAYHGVDCRDDPDMVLPEGERFQ